MRASITLSTISRFAVAVAAFWMYGAGAAWAGGGGESLTTVQQVIGNPAGTSGFCSMLKMGTSFSNGTTCPQLPTFTQGILEAAGLENSPPEMVAVQNTFPAGNNVYAGNPVPQSGTVPFPFPLTAATAPTLSDFLATLTPLAFISGSKATGPIVTLSTNGATAVTSTALNFAATKGLRAGQAYSIADATTATAIPPSTLLTSFTGTTVTMSANAAGPGVGSGDKITFTPIANPAAAAQLYNPDADAFLYAAAVSTYGSTSTPGGTIPDTLYLFSDDLSRNNQKFSNGQIVAKFSFPLTVLNNDGSESAVMTKLEVLATSSGLQAQIISGFGASTTQPIAAGSLGINVAVVFGPSPTSSQNHAIFQVAVPLLVTGACYPTSLPGDPFCPDPLAVQPNNDPAYFYTYRTGGSPPSAGPINIGLYSIFASFDDYFTPPSATPPILGTNGFAIGIAPSAGPLGSPPSCTGTGCTPPSPIFALCASLPNNSNGPSAQILPSVAAYYAISTAGETLLSATLPSAPLPSTSVCPAL